MITSAASCVRELEYFKAKKSYMFDLDYIPEEDLENQEEYSVDATTMGNVSRFINHGCEPNAFVSITNNSNNNKISLFIHNFIGIPNNILPVNLA